MREIFIGGIIITLINWFKTHIFRGHQISTLQTQTLKTSKLLCYNESHYYQTCKRQKSKRDTRRYNYEEDSEDDDDNLTEEEEEEEDEVVQVNFLEHR